MPSETFPTRRTAASRLAYVAAGHATALALPIAGSALVGAVAASLDRLDAGSRSCFSRNLDALAPGLSGEARRRMLRDMQRARARAILEMLAAGGRPERWLDRRVKFHGLPGLQAACAARRGAVVLCNHLGVWDVALRALARRGLASAAHADRPLGPVLWRGVCEERLRAGVHYVPRRSGLAPLLEMLRRGGLAVIAWDGHSPRDRADALRGIRAAAQLSRRSGAPLFRGSCLPEGGGYQVYLDGPHRSPADAPSVERLTEELTRAELRWIAERAPHWGLRRAIDLPACPATQGS